MAIAGVYNGSDMLLYLNGEILVYSTNTSFEVSQKLKDTTCRETESWNSSVPGMRNWGMSAEGAVAFRTTSGTPYASEPNYINVSEIINNHIITRDPVTVVLVPPGVQTNNLKWSGSAYITSVSVDTPNEDTSTFSISLSGKNELLQNTNSIS
mgnify:FL=1